MSKQAPPPPENVEPVKEYVTLPGTVTLTEEQKGVCLGYAKAFKGIESACIFFKVDNRLMLYIRKHNVHIFYSYRSHAITTFT